MVNMIHWKKRIAEQLASGMANVSPEDMYVKFHDETERDPALEDEARAWFARPDDCGMPPAIMLKKDSSSLYHTRDVAADIYRKQTYDFDNSRTGPGAGDMPERPLLLQIEKGNFLSRGPILVARRVVEMAVHREKFSQIGDVRRDGADRMQMQKQVAPNRPFGREEAGRPERDDEQYGGNGNLTSHRLVPLSIRVLAARFGTM